jgi:pSer/pThr/pTyr-binding forkhead associated (FHA) protein
MLAVRDLGSANGTLVNGKRIAGPPPGSGAAGRVWPRHALQDGDLIQLGDIDKILHFLGRCLALYV